MSDETPAGRPGDVHSIFHININCTSFARSLAFYELLGFEIVLDFSDTDAKPFGEIGLGPVLALPDNCDGRAALLMPKGRRDGPRIDLIEWSSPKVEGQSRANLAQPGVGRICLRTLDADALHARCGGLPDL
jgi:catechol 2,3-dioxygenase-like lactoylglutathione lyase family enzyme